MLPYEHPQYGHIALHASKKKPYTMAMPAVTVYPMPVPTRLMYWIVAQK